MARRLLAYRRIAFVRCDMTVPSEPPARVHAPSTAPSSEAPRTATRRRHGTLPSTPRSILDALKRTRTDGDKQG